jgi:hypothetical protein
MSEILLHVRADAAGQVVCVLDFGEFLVFKGWVVDEDFIDVDYFFVTLAVFVV